ncbi:MAG: hypothetical protein CVU40_04750 [Chloroflexi bacterium HGW-Chloroflexi-2]|jgi:hypothetical protein|nr:MAG: hypothetical protein CVU40_04750 [Chloroflexi bacterium HGW-Chloroflexi-2]
MNKIANDFSSENIGSIFIYTNEAHPGESYPHLTSMKQKNTHAKALRDVLGVNRPILLDALDGACHRYFGSMPNMTWIFNRSGVPVYKSDWTDANSVRNSLEYLLDVVKRRKTGVRLAPFTVERLDYRESDRVAFYQRLAENGPKAVEEFRKAFGEN